MSVLHRDGVVWFKDLIPYAEQNDSITLVGKSSDNVEYIIFLGVNKGRGLPDLMCTYRNEDQNSPGVYFYDRKVFRTSAQEFFEILNEANHPILPTLIFHLDLFTDHRRTDES